MQSIEELEGMARADQGKVLMVDCEVDGCLQHVPSVWKRLQLTRGVEDGLVQLVVDGKEFLEKKASALHYSVSIIKNIKYNDEGTSRFQKASL